MPPVKVNETSNEDYLKALSMWKKCYIKKPKSWQKVWMWWEKDKNDPKKQWFMNIARSSRNGVNESSWITANDVVDWLDYMERNGYKYYINE